MTLEAKRVREKSTLAVRRPRPISLVLGDCNLLGEIFLCLGFAIDLVHVATVNRH
jgi:hypothetical protein